MHGPAVVCAVTAAADRATHLTVIRGKKDVSNDMPRVKEGQICADAQNLGVAARRAILSPNLGRALPYAQGCT